MAINLATKYEKKIQSYFSLKSVVDGNTNNDYNFSGVKSINIYTPVTQSLTDYSRTGMTRYGTPNEMQDVLQEMILTRDRSFAITVDAGNNAEQMDSKQAGKILALEIEEQVVPEMDKYALSKFADFAGKIDVQLSAPDKTTIVATLAGAMASMSNKNVPNSGRAIYIGWTYFSALRSASEYIGNDTLGKKVLSAGQLGSFMGASVIPVPDDYLKKGSSQCYALITYKNSVMQPKKIQDYFVKQNPPGINGALIEGRFIFDAYVIGAKADGVYAIVAASTQQAAPTNTYTSGSKTMACASSGATSIMYTTDGTDPRYSKSAKVYSGAVDLSSFAGTTVTFKSVAFDDALFTSAVTTTNQAVAA